MTDQNNFFAATAERLDSAADYTKFDSNLHIFYDYGASRELDGNYYEVTRSFKYYIDEGKTKWVYVPAGYLTDGASVPRPFWWLLPPIGRYAQAAVVHDILCERNLIYVNGMPERITRKEADFIFMQAMKVLEVSRGVRHCMFWAVRLWSEYGWTSKKSLDKLLKKQALEIKRMRNYHASIHT